MGGQLILFSKAGEYKDTSYYKPDFCVLLNTWSQLPGNNKKKKIKNLKSFFKGGREVIQNFRIDFCNSLRNNGTKI